jgi:flagellin
MLDFQIGVGNNAELDRLRYDTASNDATLGALGLSAETIGTKEGPQTTLKKLDDALVQINGVRANLGATQNRLQSAINNLGVSDENLSAANSRIRDVDVAEETAKLTKNNILIQAGASVLSQANQFPNIALKLLG